MIERGASRRGRRSEAADQALDRGLLAEPSAVGAARADASDADVFGWGGRTRTSIAGSKGRCLTSLATPQRSRL